MKLLDCTLRDGGYYTNWDFDREFVDRYIADLDKLPIDYIEIGYRSVERKGYFGEYFYLPLTTVLNIKNKTSKPLSIMLNAKDCKVGDLPQLLSDLVSIVTLVRLAVAIEDYDHGIKLAKTIKDLGFEVGVNVMRASELKINEFNKYFDGVEKYVDYLYLVDSYGSMHPQQVASLIGEIQKVTPVTVGFHGHNNIELAFANSMLAVESGCGIVDFTVLGMGRGAGNLKTELFLTYLKKNHSLNVDLNIIGNMVENFDNLQQKYKWGTNLAYMASGTYGLPQKDVMEALDLNRYSLTTIVNNLRTSTKMALPEFRLETKFETCCIVGGGASVKKHQRAIRSFLKINKDVLVIHATSKHIKLFESISNTQFSVISGDELLKFDKVPIQVQKFILGSNSSLVETFELSENLYSLNEEAFTATNQDSPFAMSLQISIHAGSKKVILVGFDGYEELKDKKELYLMQENQQIINNFVKKHALNSLTPTIYDSVNKCSVYERYSTCT